MVAESAGQGAAVSSDPGRRFTRSKDEPTSRLLRRLECLQFTDIPGPDD